jgi:tetratricopeptide (TPR) repeat protein
MSSPTFSCAKCLGEFTGVPGAGETVACPFCGARVRHAANAHRKRAKTPWWAWALGVTAVGALAAALVAGLVAGRKPDASPAGDETAGPGGPNVGQPGGGPAPQSPFAADAEPRKMTAPPAPVPAEFADTVFLLPDDHPAPTFLMPDLFERELARQALGVAAREEFGLRVRDAALGDVAPAALPGDRQFRVRRVPSPGPWAVVAGLPGTEHQFWAGSLVGHQYLGSPDEYLAGHERLSRGFFAKCLAGAGFAAKPNRTSDAPVPAEAQKALGQMRETDQFAAVRMLHDEIRAKGESDALVAGLARGYANLALLTEFHWGSAPYAFRARGLLYAQRLVARAPNSAEARRLRAYAAALAGWHALALRDLTEARKLAAAGPPSPTPAWAVAIDHYVHFDLAKLRAARAESDTSLLRVLEFLVIEAPEAEAATIRAGRALLDAEPECYLVHDAMCRVGGVAHLHRATLTGPAVFTRRLATRVGEMPDLPATVRDALRREAVEPGVYAALRRAGGTADRGEPSWAALGGLLQDIRFTQAAHRLSFVTDFLALDPQEEAAGFAALLDGHRLLPFIESYTFDHRRDPEAVRKRLAVPDGEADLRARPYFYRLAKVDLTAAQALQARGHAHLYPEEAGRVHLYRSDRSGAVRPYVRQLLAASPHAPIGQALSAAYGDPQPAAKLAEVEAKYAEHPVVQWGLGKRHLADGRRADAIRCWKRWVELSPDGDAFRELAGLYRDASDEDRWRETLEASLKEEDTALHHARARVDLAEYYMRKKDFKRAEPYATAAAQSGAGWALLCAAECQMGLERWDEANALYEAAADRYGDPAYAWYFACRATGKMDRAAAEGAVRGHLARFGPGTSAGELFRAGRFHLLTGDAKAARPLIDRANAVEGSDLSLLFAALLADAAADAEARDAALAAFEKLAAGGTPVGPIGTALRKWSAARKPPDEAAVEAAVGKIAPEFRPDAEFCFGWFLHNRKLEERAVVLWKRCLEASAGTRWVKTHARALVESASRKKD